MILGLLGSPNYRCMDLSLIATIIETTFPNGVTFNNCGVAQRGYRYSFGFQKLSIRLEVCALNGVWGGSVHILTNVWGYSEPISRGSFTFTSFEDCAKNLWGRTHDLIERDKSGITMEFLHFKVAMRKWLTLSAEEKFNAFKEVDFYGA